LDRAARIIEELMPIESSGGATGRRAGPRLALALSAALSIAAPFHASGQAIRMSWFTLPPHVFPSEGGGRPTGPTIELFDAIAARMGYKVDWVGPIPISRLDSERETGELRLDGGILTVKTATSVKQLLYPSRPYFSATPCLGVLADNPLRRIDSIEDIDGYRIGFVRTFASVYPPFLADNRDRLDIEELSGADWTRRNVQKLVEGRLDAVFELNEYSLLYEAEMAGAGGRVKIVYLPSAPLDHYFVFNRNSPRAQALLDAYERAVAGMKFDYGAILDAEIALRAGSAGGSKGR
jgi:ABC-type amino acid transport substrate-binding protein